MKEHTTVKMTVTLPESLLTRLERWMKARRLRNRDKVIANALDDYLKQLEREAIDREFEAMAHDEEYQKLALQIEREFEQADWEAWQIAEGQR